jgi:hypothetical protein
MERRERFLHVCVCAGRATTAPLVASSMRLSPPYAWTEVPLDEDLWILSFTPHASVSPSIASHELLWGPSVKRVGDLRAHWSQSGIARPVREALWTCALTAPRLFSNR